MRGGALFKGKEGRGDFRKNSTVGRLHPRFLRFLSPGNGGTEGGVKTIEEGLEEKVEFSLQERRRGRKFSTVGQLHPLSPEFFCPLVRGTEGVVKTFKPIKNIKRN